MPELPEVESLRLGLIARLYGQKIKKVIITKPKLVSGKGNVRTASDKKVKEFIRGLTGQTLIGIDRRAKNMVFRFKNGQMLLVHLKMSGQFVYLEPGKEPVDGGHPIRFSVGRPTAPSEDSKRRRVKLPVGARSSELWRAQSERQLPNKHTHIIFEFSRGTLYYNDTRMFGYLLYYPNEKSFAAANHFEKLGLEPTLPEFTLAAFGVRLKQKSGLPSSKISARQGRLKTVLMNQEVVTGLGNIYADEVCFLARVRPTRPVKGLSSAEIKKLYAAIKKIIPRAIKLGGSSVATYRLADGSRGNYAREHKVYGRAGLPCARCGRPLTKIQINHRTTVFCKHCQK